MITLKSTGNLTHYRISNDRGHSIEIKADGSGVGPMESVLMAMASCSAVDVVSILEKMKQDVKDIGVEVVSERRAEIPRTYTRIHMHYILTGKIKEKKAEKAIALSLTKYCSVSRMIEKSAEITSSFDIIASSEDAPPLP